jgi:hypothetical protein
MIVTGLELVGSGGIGQGANTEFTGKNPQFRCRLNSPSTPANVIDVLGQIVSGSPDPLFQDFLWTFYDDTFTHLLWEAPPTTDPVGGFPYEKNAQATGGPYRTFGVSVSARAAGNLVSKPARLVVSNPQTNFLDESKIVIVPDYTSVVFRLPQPADLDFERYRIWRSDQPNFPIDLSPTGFIYDGPDTFITIPQPSGSTFYYCFAGYDAFGPIGLRISSYFQVTTKTLIPTLPPPAVTPGSQTVAAAFNAAVMVDVGQSAFYTLDGTDLPLSIPAQGEWPKAGGAYTNLLISSDCILSWRGYQADGTPTKQGRNIYRVTGALPTVRIRDVHMDRNDPRHADRRDAALSHCRQHDPLPHQWWSMADIRERHHRAGAQSDTGSLCEREWLCRFSGKRSVD